MGVAQEASTTEIGVIDLLLCPPKIIDTSMQWLGGGAQNRPPFPLTYRPEEPLNATKEPNAEDPPSSAEELPSNAEEPPKTSEEVPKEEVPKEEEEVPKEEEVVSMES